MHRKKKREGPKPLLSLRNVTSSTVKVICLNVTDLTVLQQRRTQLLSHDCWVIYVSVLELTYYYRQVVEHLWLDCTVIINPLELLNLDAHTS